MEREALESYAASRGLEGQPILQLLALNEAVPAVVDILISELCPSANTLRELLRLAEEIAARDRLLLPEVFELAPVVEGLSAAGQDRKRKQAGIRQKLEAVRYPQVQRLKDELERCRRDVVENYNVKIELPQALEGDELRCTFTVRSSSELLKFAETLEHLSADPSLRRIFAILQGKV